MISSVLLKYRQPSCHLHLYIYLYNASPHSCRVPRGFLYCTSVRDPLKVTLCDRIVILHRRANKNQIGRLSEELWYFNSAAWHISRPVLLQKVSDIKWTQLSFLPTLGRCVSPLGVSQMCFVWQQACFAHLAWQWQNTRTSAGKEGRWEGQCRAPACQRGPSMLMPPTAEPSAGYCTIVTWRTVTN